jgi:hypothetical protein
LIALAVVIGTALTCWAGWLAWSHGTPPVRSQLVGFEVVEDHSVAVRVDVTVNGDTDGMRCLVQAIAADHARVGELSYVPKVGRNELYIRTDRRATAVDNVGCVTDSQRRPR